jgi:hypothetical protein
MHDNYRVDNQGLFYFANDEALKIIGFKIRGRYG